MATQHITAARRLRFGTLGWERTGWETTYYPDDLPEDWRLGYYANELSAVLLEPQAWRHCDAGRLGEWPAEVHEAFRFYLLADPAADAVGQLQLAAALGGHLGGVLWPVAPAPEGALSPLAGLPERVRGWGEGGTLRLALLDVDGLDLRARRALLDALAPRLAEEGGQTVIADAPDITPAEVRELQTVAELMGLA